MFQEVYQGGVSVELLSSVGRDPTKKWKLKGSVKRGFDKSCKGYVLSVDGGANTYIELSSRHGLGLTQRYLTLQVCVSKSDRPFSIELSFTDIRGTRRRINLSTSFKEVHSTPLHSQVPLAGLENLRGIWTHLCIDVGEIAATCFAGHGIKTLDSIVVHSSCRLRNVFTMRAPPRDFIAPLSFDGEEQITEVEDIPKSMAFAPGVKSSGESLLIRSGQALGAAASRHPKPQSRRKPGSSRGSEGSTMSTYGPALAFGSRVAAPLEAPTRRMRLTPRLAKPDTNDQLKPELKPEPQLLQAVAARGGGGSDCGDGKSFRTDEVRESPPPPAERIQQSEAKASIPMKTVGCLPARERAQKKANAQLSSAQSGEVTERMSQLLSQSDEVTASATAIAMEVPQPDGTVEKSKAWGAGDLDEGESLPSPAAEMAPFSGSGMLAQVEASANSSVSEILEFESQSQSQPGLGLGLDNANEGQMRAAAATAASVGKEEDTAEESWLQGEPDLVSKAEEVEIEVLPGGNSIVMYESKGEAGAEDKGEGKATGVNKEVEIVAAAELEVEEGCGMGAEVKVKDALGMDHVAPDKMSARTSQASLGRDSLSPWGIAPGCAGSSTTTNGRPWTARRGKGDKAGISRGADRPGTAPELALDPLWEPLREGKHVSEGWEGAHLEGEGLACGHRDEKELPQQVPQVVMAAPHLSPPSSDALGALDHEVVSGDGIVTACDDFGSASPFAGNDGAVPKTDPIGSPWQAPHSPCSTWDWKGVSECVTEWKEEDSQEAQVDFAVEVEVESSNAMEQAKEEVAVAADHSTSRFPGLSTPRMLHRSVSTPDGCRGYFRGASGRDRPETARGYREGRRRCEAPPRPWTARGAGDGTWQRRVRASMGDYESVREHERLAHWPCGGPGPVPVPVPAKEGVQGYTRGAGGSSGGGKVKSSSTAICAAETGAVMNLNDAKEMELARQQQELALLEESFADEYGGEKEEASFHLQDFSLPDDDDYDGMLQATLKDYDLKKARGKSGMEESRVTERAKASSGAAEAEDGSAGVEKGGLATATAAAAEEKKKGLLYSPALNCWYDPQTDKYFSL